MTVEELAAAIREYAASLGRPASKVGRDAFGAARPDVSRSREVRALWPLAKSLASDGEVSDLPMEAVPPGFRVAKVSTVTVDEDGNKQTVHAVSSDVPAVATMPAGMRLAGVTTAVRTDDGLIQWIKAKAEPESHAELLARVSAEVFASIQPRTWKVDPPASSSTDDLLAVYPLGDPHVGMLAWAPESGADFDLSICEDLMVAAARDLVLRGPRTKRGMVVNLGDFFHFDNAQARTTKGEHTLDVDSRAPKVLAVGLRIMVAIVDAALEHHEQVTVDTRIGNHDGHTSLMLSLALAAHYRSEPRVHIPPTVSHRAYYEHGACLIGTTHGDRAKPDDLASIMAAERPEEWGRTKHRYWLCGHVHHVQRKELPGCIVESFRTLASRDSWHAGQGYVSGRDLTRIVYHRSHGEVSRETVSVGALLGG